MVLAAKKEGIGYIKWPVLEICANQIHLRRKM
jgi:hypothetical protein